MTIRPPRVTVVIPAWQGGQGLLDCLASVVASECQPVLILVVDNASTDYSIEQARLRFPEVEFCRNHENLGFGCACNQAIQRALAQADEFVLLLNQDARLEPNTLALILDLARRQPLAAAIGSKTLSTARTPDGDFMLLYNGAWRRWLPTWQRIPGIGRSERNSPVGPREVDYVWGHGMLLRCAALGEVGLFDPGFFMYFEDLDLCLRLQRAGWQNWCDSRAVIWHAVEEPNRAERSRLWRWQMKLASARHFCRKHYGAVLGEVFWGLTILRESEPLLRRGHFRAVAHVWQAWWRILRGVPPIQPTL